ncbi:N-acetyl-gamma-glutamyl-phosphate reductase [Bacteroides pyogenes DSM 20611 = JCM 6294]|uniref:N-acetyl-gamma-glutamyl-phosphate reductase n=1 Tax=Bacteroides pyogenes DSM 20611 = JCM 6294 TaxID=1121100 RepID=W4PJA9_9BACE|nr:N-acetyl-gamma-glutamyl-phosphate reductase [Bacteroides pyogenes DSM 20611 = JCM 6294]
MIKAGIIGGAGYTAGELVRLLLNHPETKIVFIHSNSHAGKRITDVHEGLYGETSLVFTDELPLNMIDVLFFCTAHGDTKKFLESHNLPENLKIIDLSMDYRIQSDDHDFIYGLPELNRRATCTAKHVANPGCFATCISLGLLPLAKNLMLKDDVTVNAITGSTGAGVKPGSTTHFSWRNNNISVYKAFDHQHIPEIKQSLRQLQNSFNAEIDFILSGRLPAWDLRHNRSENESRHRRNRAHVRRILRKRLFRTHRERKYRPEAGGKYEQMPDSLGKAWRQTARYLLHRQSAERS